MTPTVIHAEPTPVPGAYTKYARTVAEYIADPAARVTPLNRAAAYWYVFRATQEERERIINTADLLTPTMVVSHWIGTTEDQALRGPDWQVTASNRWDASTATTRDPDIVTVVLRRRP